MLTQAFWVKVNTRVTLAPAKYVSGAIGSPAALPVISDTGTRFQPSLTAMVGGNTPNTAVVGISRLSVTKDPARMK